MRKLWRGDTEETRSFAFCIMGRVMMELREGFFLAPLLRRWKSIAYDIIVMQNLKSDVCLRVHLIGA
jgi:hypothetical protein